MPEHRQEARSAASSFPPKGEPHPLKDMPDPSAASPSRKRIWTGGAYPDREGVEVRADGAGITIEPWYDGGIGILGEESVRLTWGELDRMREAAHGT